MRFGMWRTTLKSAAFSVGMRVVTLIVCTLIGEALLRAADGYRLTTVRSIPTRSSEAQGLAAQRRDVARQYVGAIPLAQGMRREWFELSPPLPSARGADPALGEAAARFTAAGVGSDAAHMFNWQFVRGRLCSDRPFLDFPGFIFLFDPPQGSEYPRYRFPRDAVTGGGLVTNQFGWRGAAIAFQKPARTIRLAFVGASTTANNHAYPFSYPELAGFWLGLWLRELDPELRVEVINAGREGITSTDIAAIVRDEVLPMQPDIVVYYEGANQFVNWSLIRERHPGRPRIWVLDILSYAQPYSATVERVSQLVRFGADLQAFLPSFEARLQGTEPIKPPYEVVWPADVDEQDPPLAHPNLPSNLSTIVRDLDDMQVRLRGEGGDFVLSSFFWLVFEGMRLDPVRNRMLFDYLNTLYHPFRYREMARFAAFQNRVLQKFAAWRDIHFVDVAGVMPPDPNLFFDAVHATYDGIRLHAWFVAQQLAPLLGQRIAQGRLPRAPGSGRAPSRVPRARAHRDDRLQGGGSAGVGGRRSQDLCDRACHSTLMHDVGRESIESPPVNPARRHSCSPGAVPDPALPCAAGSCRSPAPRCRCP
jgi:hypothetical protein